MIDLFIYLFIFILSFRCNPCNGDGKLKCSHCGGDGRVKVTVDKDGKNHTEEKRCSTCGGDGQVRCNTCAGDGKILCKICSGHGYLRYFIEMTRTHKTLKHMKSIDNIPDKDLSPQEIQKAKGAPILEKTSVKQSQFQS